MTDSLERSAPAKARTEAARYELPLVSAPNARIQVPRARAVDRRSARALIQQIASAWAGCRANSRPVARATRRRCPSDSAQIPTSREQQPWSRALVTCPPPGPGPESVRSEA
ncbi:MAG: hypothetical protein HY815_11415 [Candidatus Riflebacteria bacterium]|nr:hypothetical protein [Candidatus Riflebacteria bacterium]